MIRAITAHELKSIIHLGPKFWKEGNLPGEFIPEVFIRKWSEHIAAGHGHIFGLYVDRKVVGAIGLFIVNDINDDARVASEMFWFVDEEHRGGGLVLFRHAERYAKASGCKRMSMVHLVDLHPKGLEKLYERTGYRLIEKNYHKTF